MSRIGNRYPRITHWTNVRLGDIEIASGLQQNVVCRIHRNFLFNVQYLVFFSFMLVFVVCMNRLLWTKLRPMKICKMN